MKTFLYCILAISIAASSGSLAYAQNAEVKILKEELSGGFFNRVSPNGQYVVGHIPNGSGYLYNVTTGEIKLIESPEGGMEYNLPKRVCTAEDVSNNGVVCGIFLSPGAMIEHKNQDGTPVLDEEGNPLRSCARVPGVYKDGVWKELERHDDEVPLMGSSSDGVASGISTDGSKVTGAVHAVPGAEGHFTRYATTVWNAETGEIIKEHEEGCTQASGGRAWSMSDDASLLGGWSETGGSRGPAIWHNGEYIRIAPIGDVNAISPNGKFAAGRADYSPFIWTKETGTVKYPAHEGAAKGVITGIANDGTAIGYSETNGRPKTRSPFIITKDGTFHDLLDYLKEACNFTLPDEWIPESDIELTPANYMNTAMDISADGTVICGFTDTKEPWVIKMNLFSDIEQESYSNPVFTVNNRNLTIHSDGKIASVAIFNLAGQMLINKEVNTNQYSVCSETKGTYLIRVTLAKGTVIMRKVVL